MRRRAGRGAALALLLLTAAAALARADDLADEADRLAAARVDAATSLRATEDRLAELDEQIAALQARHAQAEAAAAAASARLTPMLPLAERLGLYPAETLLTVPAPPEQAVRGLLVLQGVARAVRAEIAALVDERARADAMARDLEQARQQQAAAMAQQAAAAAALDAQLAEATRRRDLAQDAATRAAQAAAAAAARADSLRGAIASLASPRKAAATPASVVPPPSPAPGGWTVPVAGRLTGGFGAATEAGPASGATFQPPAGARVVAPCAGRVVFSGPFRSYGRMLILACGAGMHAVLAGLGRLDAAAGQAVRSGEPVGVMAPEGGALYVEIRRGGLPVDPAQYLRQDLRQDLHQNLHQKG